MKKCIFSSKKQEKAKNKKISEEKTLPEEFIMKHSTNRELINASLLQEVITIPYYVYFVYFGLNKRKIKYISSQTAIRYRFSPSPYYYINHIFNYLREHKELLKSRAYNRIYKETLDYLVLYAVKECGWNKWEKRKNRKSIEFLADLWNKHNTSSFSKKFTKEQVDEFLEYRKIVWQ